jgi:hypothetical protein
LEFQDKRNKFCMTQLFELLTIHTLKIAHFHYFAKR